MLYCQLESFALLLMLLKLMDNLLVRITPLYQHERSQEKVMASVILLNSETSDGIKAIGQDFQKEIPSKRTVMRQQWQCRQRGWVSKNSTWEWEWECVCGGVSRDKQPREIECSQEWTTTN